jgi:hypothetical protein
MYFLGISMTDPIRVIEWRRENVQNPKRGVMMIWHELYGTYNSDAGRVVPLDQALGAGWVMIRVPRVETGTRTRPSAWVVLLSPLDINGKATGR